MASLQDRDRLPFFFSTHPPRARLPRQNLQDQRTYTRHRLGIVQYHAEKVKIYQRRFYLNRKISNEEYWY